MTILDVREYSILATDQNARQLAAGKEPAIASQQVTFTVSSVPSNAFNESTRFVRVHANGTCRIEFGSNPTASGTSMRMAAGATEYFGVTPGMKVAAIDAT